MNYIELSYWDLVAGGVLVVLAAGLSLYLQLGLEKRLAIAAVRMVVQLLLVGLVLKLLFSLVSPFWTLLTALCMIGFAGREVMARQEGGMPRLLS
jgi:putative ABC transport system permease protein